MAARWWLPLLLYSVALAANVKLYLKDGGHHVVREYQVMNDRVRFYSVERSEWEEIPLELVDLKRTEGEVRSRKEALEEESKVIAAEEKAEREDRRRVARIPVEPGVYYEVSGKLTPLKQAESKVRTNKKRSILKVLSPIPIMGKGFVELDGEQSQTRLNAARPEFYMRLSVDQRFGMIRLKPVKGVRQVEKVDTEPVTKTVMEEQDPVPVFRQQLADGLYKIWPEQELAPGEYAMVEYTEGKLNIQIWDFAYDPAAK